MKFPVRIFTSKYGTKPVYELFPFVEIKLRENREADQPPFADIVLHFQNKESWLKSLDLNTSSTRGELNVAWCRYSFDEAFELMAQELDLEFIDSFEDKGERLLAMILFLAVSKTNNLFDSEWLEVHKAWKGFLAQRHILLGSDQERSASSSSYVLELLTSNSYLYRNLDDKDLEAWGIKAKSDLTQVQSIDNIIQLNNQRWLEEQSTLQVVDAYTLRVLSHCQQQKLSGRSPTIFRIDYDIAKKQAQLVVECQDSEMDTHHSVMPCIDAQANENLCLLLACFGPTGLSEVERMTWFFTNNKNQAHSLGALLKFKDSAGVLEIAESRTPSPITEEHLRQAIECYLLRHSTGIRPNRSEFNLAIEIGVLSYLKAKSVDLKDSQFTAGNLEYALFQQRKELLLCPEPLDARYLTLVKSLFPHINWQSESSDALLNTFALSAGENLKEVILSVFCLETADEFYRIFSRIMDILDPHRKTLVATNQSIQSILGSESPIEATTSIGRDHTDGLYERYGAER